MPIFYTDKSQFSIVGVGIPDDPRVDSKSTEVINL